MSSASQTIAPSVAVPDTGLRILLILSALMAFSSISTDIYLPALPAIAAALHAPSGTVQLSLSGFLVGFSLGQLIWGPLGDRFGRRRPIALGVVLFVIGSIGCALSTTAWDLIAWRVVEAIGASAGPVLARAMVRDLFARNRAAQMMSTLLVVMGIAPLVGPILGGQIIVVSTWPAIFWTLVVFGAVALVGLRWLPESLPADQRTSDLAAALKGYVELVSSRRLIGYAISGGFFYGGIYAYLAGTPFAYIEYYHVPSQAYGLLFGLNIIGMMAINIVNRKLVMTWGSEKLFRIGALAAALAAIALAMDARFGWGGLAGLVVPLCIYVSALGFIVPNSVAGALAAFPDKAGAASAVVGAVHYSTGILTAAMIGWFADGTPWTMGWIIGLCGIGTLASSALLLRPTSSAVRLAATSAAAIVDGTEPVAR